ncbi:MAG TPA: hypothetical protein VGN19_04795, partial [Pedococcus sp.]|nr:hypothetical protein [Pedococcus sp.]
MGRASERVGIVGLAAFLAVDVALVVLALGSTRSPVSGAGLPVGGATTSVTGSATPSDKTTAAASGASSTTGASGPRIQIAPLTVGLVAVDQSTAMRFTVGTCAKGGSVLEVSRDGGATWSARSTPFDSVVRIRVKPNQSLFSVGANRA